MPTDNRPLRWWQRFYVRLGALFLVLLVGLGLLQAMLAVGAAEEVTLAADQELHRDLALDLAPRFEPLLVDSVDAEAIDRIIDGLTSVNRRLDVYLLGPNGMIKEWFMDADKRPLIEVVDVAPLVAFERGTPSPVLGEDPARPGEYRPFSVAPITIMGEEGCFLYLILQGEEYDHVLAMLNEGLFARLAVRTILLALVLTGLIGLVLFWWLARRLTRLRTVVAAFERGDLAQRFPVRSDDEIGRLGLTFNTMAGRIEEQVDELKRTDRLRRELVANVSHDLRSPLASIQGYLETLQLKDETLEPERRRHYLGVALAQTRRLGSLVGQLFELSKLDARQVEPQCEAFPVAELVQDVVMTYEAEAEKRGIALRAELPDGRPLVRADIGLIERVLSNLLDNALRFTPEGGHVEVRSVQEGRVVYVEVRDSGVGIAPEVLPHVFDRFIRADASRSRHADDGAGLGLAIARRIVELHGGTIEADSTEGEGTVFRFGLSAA